MVENCTLNITEYKLLLDSSISSIVGLLFLLVILVVEIYYICCYNSKFIVRLLFYKTFLANTVDISFTVDAYLMLLCLIPEAYMSSYLISFAGVFWYIQYIEVMLFFSIQITLVTKIYASIADGRLNRLCSLRLFCSKHRKQSEVMFVIVHILLPVLILIGFGTDDLMNREDDETLYNILKYILLALDILIIIISCFFVILLFRFLCILRRKNLLKKKTKQVCKEFGFIIWVQFVLAAAIITVFLSYLWRSTTNSAYFFAVRNPIVRVFMPAGVFFYIILTVYASKRRK